MIKNDFKFKTIIEIDDLCKKVLEEVGSKYHTIKVNEDSVKNIMKIVKKHGNGFKGI